MARHIVAALADVPPGSRRVVELEDRRIALFNIRGELFAINDRCPHEGGSLCTGRLTGLLLSDEPGEYHTEHAGEIIRCPWHGWEFHLRTGRSQCDPRTMRVRMFDVHVEHGADLLQQKEKEPEELVAEVFPVRVENDYVVIDI